MGLALYIHPHVTGGVNESEGQSQGGKQRRYRRDRHKDAQLQQHGYLVLRFLAADLGESLGHVLDTISRMIVERAH